MKHVRKNYLRGFTLLELLIVISIMGMIAATGMFLFQSMGRKVQFEGAAKTLRDKIVLARTSAITKARRFKVLATETSKKEWKIVTIDSVDNIFGNDDDEVIDRKPYYMPRNITLPEEQEIEFTPEGGISYSTSNPIVVTDKTDTREIWTMTLTLYKAAGMARVSDIIKTPVAPEELKAEETPARAEAPETEDELAGKIGLTTNE